jgi:Arm DNA-binding domain
MTDKPINQRYKRAARKQRLQELTVQKARPEAKTYLIWDTKQRHLALQVQPTGSKAWKVIYSRHGRPRWLHLGGADAIGLADARTLAAEAMLAVAKGGDPAADKHAERGAGTFAELHEKYLEQHARKHNKSWRQPDALIRRFALSRWGKLQASTITRGDVKQMMARIEAPIVANQTLAAVSAVFTWGTREELVIANPCKLVPRNATKSRERVLAESEVPLFWQAFDALDDAVAAAALKMVLVTGQRPGEVAHMRREQRRLVGNARGAARDARVARHQEQPVASGMATGTRTGFAGWARQRRHHRVRVRRRKRRSDQWPRPRHAHRVG